MARAGHFRQYSPSHLMVLQSRHLPSWQKMYAAWKQCLITAELTLVMHVLIKTLPGSPDLQYLC